MHEQLVQISSSEKKVFIFFAICRENMCEIYHFQTNQVSQVGGIGIEGIKIVDEEEGAGEHVVHCLPLEEIYDFDKKSEEAAGDLAGLGRVRDGRRVEEYFEDFINRVGAQVHAVTFVPSFYSFVL